MKKLMLFPLLVLLSGCELYDVNGHFAGSNQSSHTIQFIVESKNAGPRLSPNATARFDAKVSVSSQSGGTDPVYKQTNAQVQVFDLTENRLIQQTISCLAGENTLTYLTYVVYQGGYEQIQCSNSY
jgi:hypothetical protein